MELNYDIDLSLKNEWWRYFGEYKFFIDHSFSRLIGGEIYSISLPMAFCIRHTLELGYKMNLIELEKVSDYAPKINFNGKSAHNIYDLHLEFSKTMLDLFKKLNVDKSHIKEFKTANSRLKKFNKLMHNLDNFSYSFRYPEQQNKTKVESKKIINFKEIKELYDSSINVLKYSTDFIEGQLERKKTNANTV